MSTPAVLCVYRDNCHSEQQGGNCNPLKGTAPVEMLAIRLALCAALKIFLLNSCIHEIWLDARESRKVKLHCKLLPVLLAQWCSWFGHKLHFVASTFNASTGDRTSFSFAPVPTFHWECVLCLLCFISRPWSACFTKARCFFSSGKKLLRINSCCLKQT